MAGAGAGGEPGSPGSQALGAAGGGDPRAGSDWAKLPADLLEKVASTLVAQTEAAWAAHLKEDGWWTEVHIKEIMAKRKWNGNCPLFAFARVCKGWRKAQLKVGGPLRTRVKSDVLLPGRVALAKWALAEGCPRDDGYGYNMDKFAARYRQAELVKWLCGEGAFVMDAWLMMEAADSGNLELVRWLRAEGCPWTAFLRDKAATKFGYTDDFGNLEEKEYNYEYGYEDSDEVSDDE